MTMQRGQGHVATTHQSILSEGIHADVIERAAQEKGFDLVSAVEFDQLVGNPTYAFTKNGRLTKMKADGGWVICPSTGKLIGASSSGDSEDIMLAEAAKLFKAGNIIEGRQQLMQYLALYPGRIEDTYRWMYDNLDLWGNTQERKDAAIITIRNGLANLSLVGIPEINLAATLVELTT